MAHGPLVCRLAAFYYTFPDGCQPMNKQQTRAFVPYYSITGGLRGGGLAVCSPEAEQ